MSGASQGLFAAVDEAHVVVVEHAEAITSESLIPDFSPGATLVLVTTEKLPGARSRRPAKSSKQDKPPPIDLVGLVKEAGGVVERITRLPPFEVASWVTQRAVHHRVALKPAAAETLAAVVGPDSDRIEQELQKLGAFAGDRPIEVADVRALVSGAIESDVFALTEAVVKRDPATAMRRLAELEADGQAPQQILALLVWQFRVLLFASAMNGQHDAERMAKAIHASSPASLFRWQAQARRIDQKIVTRAYESLYATDLAIKQGRTDPEAALLLCVLDLCGVANADPRELVVGEPPRR